tara:strand:+ start:1356 stop:1841 length:486 start_codon:yes stop_codon:yes gene_type:complete
MRCPACDNELTEYKVSGIKVEICRGSCGGIWLNHSQIKNLKHLKPGAGRELLLFDKTDGVKTYRNSEHPCPNCETTLLYRHFFSRKYDTEVNQCSKCSGFWIDLGGLTEILISRKKNKRDLIENYFTVIRNEKISRMNLANQDIAEAAELITVIFNFLRPS